jgi:hypothetical protein
MIAENTAKKNYTRRGCLFAVAAVLAVFCLLEILFAGGSNAYLAARNETAERLSELDKARLLEAAHLMDTFADSLWPGWRQADIPLIVYTDKFAFLVGYPDPAAGWKTFPGNASHGRQWEIVSGDTFDGDPYYRQALPTPGDSPQAFTVAIADRWVASVPSREWLETGMGNEFVQGIPAGLRPLIPNRFAARMFLSVTGGTDLYECMIAHETFHAFEGVANAPRLAAAETVFQTDQSRYPWGDDSFRNDWQTELDLLADAVQAKSTEDAAGLARQFLKVRDARRAAAGLDADLINMERLKEWEEGLAKYTELAIWQMGAEDAYHPVAALAADTGFHQYKNIDGIWNQQIDQIRRMAGGEGDLRFYYSGLAQAILLDRLAPGWRTDGILTGGFLEELLRNASN